MCTDINNERRRSSVGFTSLQVVKPSSKYLSIDSFLTICTMHETFYIVHDTSPTTTFFLTLLQTRESSFSSSAGLTNQVKIFHLPEDWRWCCLSRVMTGTQCLTMKTRLSPIGQRAEQWGGTLYRFKNLFSTPTPSLVSTSTIITWLVLANMFIIFTNGFEIPPFHNTFWLGTDSIPETRFFTHPISFFSCKLFIFSSMCQPTTSSRAEFKVFFWLFKVFLQG